jgi:NAD(P)-dependent dehydrogenase (short-subunit alcohol dehydrogenase family)
MAASRMSFKLLEPTRHDVYPFIDPRQGMKNAATGKTALVTGSGAGIGRAISESFAIAGASELILTARRQAPLEETKKLINGSAPDCKVSVFGGVGISNYDSVKKMFDALKKPPDVVISNAAVSMATATVAESDPLTWFKEIDINIKGACTVAKIYVDAVKAANKEGCLINVSSNASWRYIPGRSSYAISKVAMNALSEYIHREGGPVRCKLSQVQYFVKVFTDLIRRFPGVAMHPGGVLTEMASAGNLPEAIKRVLVDTPALPGGTAVYLCTDRARFLMGRFVPATWDMEQLEKERERIETEDLLKTRVLGVMY